MGSQNLILKKALYMSKINDTYLPCDGYSRFKQFQPFCPISREKFRQLVRGLKAPQPTYLSSRCALYKNSELHEFLRDINNYKAQEVK